METSEALKRLRDYLGSEEFNGWDRFRRLKRFVDSTDKIPKARFSILTLKLDGSQEGPFDREEYTELDHFLTQYPLEPEACRLFLVENICPETVALLHERLGVELDVFVKHVDNEPWFRSHDVTRCVPELPSSQIKRNFLQIRHIETLSVYDNSDPKSPPSGDVLDSCEDLSFKDIDLWHVRADSKTRNSGKLGRLWRLPDKRSTRIPRPAEKLIRQSRPKIAGFEVEHFCPVLWPRHISTIWFKHNELGGWVGVVLLDPIFEATMSGRNGECRLQRGSESYECNLPSNTKADGKPAPLKSSRSVITDLWSKVDQTQRKTAISDCFTILHPLYTLVAHEWNVSHTYMLQEIHTIEFKLEVADPVFSDLEIHLKQLYAHRRRCLKYYEVITEAKEQCKTGGQRSWHPVSGVPRSEISQDLERDFEKLQSDTRSIETRIDKTIALLASLIDIGGGKQSLIESRGISRLTFFATTFIPASTVATILGIEQPFAPGSDAFWVFWAVAIPLTIAAFGIVYSASIQNQLMGLVESPRLTLRKRSRGRSTSSV